ncbi:MAG: hypothetical protein IJV36_01335 [Prevotella sp.]|nr:hypothetical protein [Prevotella sp.]
MKYIMGIDEGTTGCKACIFDENGKLISMAYREYQSYYPNPGWVEQDITEISECVFSSSREAVKSANRKGIKTEDIVAISHSNVGITFILLDEKEQLIRKRGIGWQDLRCVEMYPEIQKTFDAEKYWNISGMLFGSYNNATANWLQKNEPENWSKVRHLCSHQDYFLRLYGADGFYIDEGSSNFLGMARKEDGEWDDYLLKVYNIDKSILPKVIHKPGAVVGEVNEKSSQLLGLAVGTKVCSGNCDTSSAVVGAGAKDPQTQVLIIGTGGVSLLITDKLLMDDKKRLTLRTNPAYNNYMYYIMSNTGASSFRWFRNELCSMEVATAQLMHIDPYDMITTIAQNSKPGANGITALTCFQGLHTRLKNENARGAVIGLTLGTSKADIAQAILEGICFEMKDVLLMYERLTGKVKKIRLCGGVGKSPYWCQMFADIFERPIELTEVPEVGCLGAAMCAGIGAGIYRDAFDAAEKCVHVRETYTPNAEVNHIYRAAFEKWFECLKVVNANIYK